MNPEKQRIAIAEALGWTQIMTYRDGPPMGVTPEGDWWKQIPDYLNDLNACREFELFLMDLPRFRDGGRFDIDGYHEYCGHLWRIVAKKPSDAYYHYSDLGAYEEVVSATAAQRCEAFLKTLSLWREQAF